MYRKPLVIHPNSRMVYVIESLDEEGMASQQLIQYAEVIQTPEQVHSYSLNPFALWTAKAKGKDANELVSFLKDNTQNVLFPVFIEEIVKDMDCFGALEFTSEEGDLILNSKISELITQIKEIKDLESKIIDNPDSKTLVFAMRNRREVKKILFENRYYVKDRQYEFGDELDLKFIGNNLTPYQQEAVDAYLSYNEQAGGGGTIILPPNSGEKLV